MPLMTISGAIWARCLYYWVEVLNVESNIGTVWSQLGARQPPQCIEHTDPSLIVWHVIGDSKAMISLCLSDEQIACLPGLWALPCWGGYSRGRGGGGVEALIDRHSSLRDGRGGRREHKQQAAFLYYNNRLETSSIRVRLLWQRNHVKQTLSPNLFCLQDLYLYKRQRPTDSVISCSN